MTVAETLSYLTWECTSCTTRKTARCMCTRCALQAECDDTFFAEWHIKRTRVLKLKGLLFCGGSSYSNICNAGNFLSTAAMHVYDSDLPFWSLGCFVQMRSEKKSQHSWHSPCQPLEIPPLYLYLPIVPPCNSSQGCRVYSSSGGDLCRAASWHAHMSSVVQHCRNGLCCVSTEAL